MDLGLYWQVARRHRRLVIAGLALTFALAILSYVRISPSGIGYRSSEVWSNKTRLILSQPGFPEYRAVLPSGDRRRAYWAIAGLSDVYAAYVTSDDVVTELRKRRLLDPSDIEDGGLPIAGIAIPSTVNSVSTPVIEITASGDSATAATRLTRGAADAFITMIERRQSASGIPEDERINVLVVERPGVPKLIAPRSKTPLILTVLLGLTMTFAAALVLDNLQRKRREALEVPEPELVEVIPETATRRVARKSPSTRKRRPARTTADTTSPQLTEAEDEVVSNTPSRWSTGSSS